MAFGPFSPAPAGTESAPHVGARIKVIGVGGGGNNAVNRMIDSGMKGVEFISVNTDVQSLQTSLAKTTLQLGARISRGLGSGGNPEIGRSAAIEDADEIITALDGADMVFITAGLGGGTGTGAAPIVASLASRMGALTVAVVTRPFAFEGKRRMAQAQRGLEELLAVVDTLIVIPNEKLLSVAHDAGFFDSFQIADDVLRQAVQGIADIITLPGLINRDFADVRATIAGMGYAVMGSASRSGPARAAKAAMAAIASPLLDDAGIDGARGILMHVSGSSSLKLAEVNEAAMIIQRAAHEDANILFGTVLDEELGDKIKITVIAAGFRDPKLPREVNHARSSLPEQVLPQPRTLDVLYQAIPQPFPEQSKEVLRAPEPPAFTPANESLHQPAGAPEPSQEFVFAPAPLQRTPAVPEAISVAATPHEEARKADHAPEPMHHAPAVPEPLHEAVSAPAPMQQTPASPEPISEAATPHEEARKADHELEPMHRAAAVPELLHDVVEIPEPFYEATAMRSVVEIEEVAASLQIIEAISEIARYEQPLLVGTAPQPTPAAPAEAPAERPMSLDTAPILANARQTAIAAYAAVAMPEPEAYQDEEEEEEEPEEFEPFAFAALLEARRKRLESMDPGPLADPILEDPDPLTDAILGDPNPFNEPILEDPNPLADEILEDLDPFTDPILEDLTPTMQQDAPEPVQKPTPPWLPERYAETEFDYEDEAEDVIDTHSLSQPMNYAAEQISTRRPEETVSQPLAEEVLTTPKPRPATEAKPLSLWSSRGLAWARSLDFHALDFNDRLGRQADVGPSGEPNKAAAETPVSIPSFAGVQDPDEGLAELDELDIPAFLRRDK